MGGLAQFLIGHELDGRYRLGTVLGEGGFGVVFRAEDLRRGRDVAVKVMVPPPGMTPAQVERLRQRFAHEAEIAARLPLHPNLVRVLDFGRTDELDFLVMELLRGESLRERLARPEPIPLRSAMHLLRDAARGVAVGHENGLVHRDLKPANIFLEQAGGGEPMVRILDFGIAKLLDDEDAEETRMHLTLPGEWFGSKFYSASEHLRRESVTRASDVFSLGVVAFELLTRTRLFTQADMARREQGLPVPIPSLLARNPDVPRDVEEIVRRALAEDAAARFVDAGALATELHRALSRMRRHTDLPADATVAVPAAEAPDDATVLAVAGDADGATVLADVQAPGVRSRWGRRGRDAAPTALDAELERVRMRRLRKRALQAATVAVMATGAVAGGYGLAAMRAETGGGSAITAPPPERSAAEENEFGLSEFRARRYGAALQAFARAKQKAPEQAEYANNHAYALLRAGRPAEAAAALADVVARYPEREVAYSNLAEAQLANGDTADAIATMQSLLALDPGPTRRREAEILLNRLDAHATDLAEWEDVRDAPWPPVVTQPDPYGDGWQSGGYPDATVESVIVTQDTVLSWEDVDEDRTGVIRRRRP